MQTKVPRITAVFAMNDEANRKKLAGVFDYMRERVRWEVSLTEPDAVSASALKNADGALIADSRPMKRPPGLPVVVLRMPRVREKGLFYVVCDNRAVSEAAFAHLERRGFSSFAYIHPKERATWSDERAEAFADFASRSRGSATLPVRFWPDGAFASMSDWLRQLPQKTAVFAADDLTARDAMLRCHTLGIEVPRDLAFIGVDNDELLCGSCPAPLTSVEPDFRRAGCLAAELLDSLLSSGGRRAPQTTLYGVARTVERESTRLVAHRRDPRVEKALDFIRANCSEPIGVLDVAREIRVSRRTAEMFFRQKLKKSVAELIRLARLDAMMKRLRETSLTASEICATSGFQSESHAKRAFKSHFGRPMSSFRR